MSEDIRQKPRTHFGLTASSTVVVAAVRARGPGGPGTRTDYRISAEQYCWTQLLVCGHCSTHQKGMPDV